jgi:hypothetical protein
VRSNVFRALRVLGLVCEHRFHNNEIDPNSVNESDDKALDGKSLTWQNFTSSCYQVFLKYLGKCDADTKSKALLAMGGIFVSQPRLLLNLEKEGLIEAVMAEDSPPLLQRESLVCWRKILIVSGLERTCLYLLSPLMYVDIHST